MPTNMLSCSPQVRHQASQDDKLDTYGWLRHDGRTFGRQVLVDEDYNITVSMVREGEREVECGNWKDDVVRRVNASMGEWRGQWGWDLRDDAGSCKSEGETGP